MMETTARVIAEYRAHYDIALGERVAEAKVRGTFHQAEEPVFPKVGDYVTVVPADDTQYTITAIQPRKNAITRRLTFDDTMQTMVANIDLMLIVMGLDNDFNVRRLKRYLALAAENEVQPAVILTKQDIAEEVDAKVAAVTDAVSSGTPVVPVSSLTGEGVAAVRQLLSADSTAVLLGSSGAGKSTLLNALHDDQVTKTGHVRKGDDRGRHTTTKRQLYRLESGAAIIDTPGMRELAMDDEAESAEAAYPKIAALTYECKFSNCDHNKSAGCAVTAAAAVGEVNAADVAAFLKLKNREQRHRRTRGIRYTKQK